MNRFKGRPARGLPGELPQGEAVLWQGAPEWKSLALRAFRIRIIVGYFAFLLAWRVGAPLVTGHGLAFAAASGISGLILGASSTGLFLAFAWLICRTTVYTVTSRRVVITYGMALPKSVNLPFSRIEAADMALHGEGTGDIALRLPKATRLSYLLLWPHVRSGAEGRAMPVLRCVAKPQAVAALLTQGLMGALPEGERAVTTAARPAPADAALIPAQARAA
jgi:hypothetical protein